MLRTKNYQSNALERVTTFESIFAILVFMFSAFFASLR